MDLTPRAVHEKQFHDAWRGYNQEEVDDFLDRVAETMDRLTRENQALHQRINELDHAVASGRETEDMLKKTLVTAQKAAEEAIASARSKAETLIAEAEERVAKANTEAKGRMVAFEDELRRKTLDADREHATHKRDLEASIERLRGFESELKQRLTAFLEQQQRALEGLLEHKGRPAEQGERSPEVEAPRSTPQEQPQRPAQAPPASHRLHATPSPRAGEAQGPGPREGTVDLAEEEAAPARRGLRGLFWGDES